MILYQILIRDTGRIIGYQLSFPYTFHLSYCSLPTNTFYMKIGINKSLWSFYFLRLAFSMYIILKAVVKNVNHCFVFDVQFSVKAVLIKATTGNTINLLKFDNTFE